MKEIFIILELVSKVLDRIPTASQAIKLELLKLRRAYAEELVKEKHNRDDALIDNLRDRILELSNYAISLLNAKGNFNSDNSRGFYGEL